MIDNNTKLEILNQKAENVEKKRQRFFTIVLILPLIFYLLKNSIIEEVDLIFFTIKQIKVILLFFPTLFAVIFFYIIVLTNHNSRLIEEINYIATGEKDSLIQYQKNSWIKYIQPVNILGDILGSIKSGGLIGCLGSLFVFLPLIIGIILYPITFFIYTIINNVDYLRSEYNAIALGNIILSVWIFISLIIYSKSAK